MALNLCGLQAAEANRAVLRYLAEDPACWGVTPSSGASREMRIISSSLTANKETVVSNELRADRMVSDVVEVAASSGGEINVEFSAGSLDDFMQAFLLGQWTRPMTFDKFEGTSLSITDTGAATRIDISGGDFTAYFTPGRRLKTEGFTIPANNDYWQIASVALVGASTQITTTVDTGFNESGTAFARLADANDVITLKSTVVRAGTSGNNTFDSNGGNAFASAIAAGQLVVGQKIYVDFKPAYETGTFVFADIAGVEETGSILFNAVADVADTVTISDGVGTTVFTFQVAGNGATGAAVNVAHGADANASATNLFNAINANLNIAITATNGTPGTVDLSNDLFVGGSIAKSDVDNDYTVTNFTGGTAPLTDGDTCTVHDGEKSVTFEFDNDGAFTRGNVGVTIGVSAAATAAALQAAIMDQLRKKKITASASVATATVTVRNLHPDQIANAALSALSDDTTAIASTSFSGAVAAFGFFTVTGLTDDVISVAEEVGTHANGGSAAITIKGSHIRNPGDLDDIQAQSFTIETGFTDVNQYFRQTGLRVGGFTMSLSAGEIVTGTLNLMGKETVTGNVSVLGNAPYDVLASTATPVLNATTNVGNLYKNGELLASAVQSIELTGEASLREQRAVSSKFPAGIGTGRFNLTGNITSYFETLEMYDHFLNHDTISLAFDFADNDRNAYWFTIPALKITTDPIAPGGIDQDVLEEMEFVALRDPNLSTQFMIDRFSSTLPASS